ncbi:methyl-accepting chemotaxis protein [Candidatus Nitronereus thalassa]|uniref:Methyl-accepting chemotaxis protein n=1 Tax=Candidatus Nitronereus thalassa TaxID=3020898 RepID=A0ABU3K677_9BACT|nr:methyl-accepting chemotaxis protein [Candidatus Nitronereus thalassa]MDT7041876.1 methyl-accepting chemotaxis protein [Candidatus Nitronereus thalassa]
MPQKQKFLGKLGLTSKLVALLLVFGVIPMAVVAYIGFSATADIEKGAGQRFQLVSENIADKIDRNLFERYGDVQAFASNQILQERYAWYNPDEAENSIVRTMNAYVKSYGMYYLSMFVDLQGDVIAVNSRDAQGNPIPTESLYTKNYADTPWFQALQNEQFTTSMPFTAPGNDVSTGTFIEDIHVDQDVKAIFPEDGGLTIGFSAPVYQGEDVIGYWTNRAKFRLVADIFEQTYPELKRAGMQGAELTLLDSKGRVILDFDPQTQGSEKISFDLENVILKLNLADKGVAMAQEAIQGKSGFMQSLHDRKQIMQVGGFTHLKGAMGFPGMNWAVLVRVPSAEAAAEAFSIQRDIWLAVLACLALIIPAGLFIGRAVIGQLKPVIAVAEQASKGDLRGRVPVTSADELGQMGQAFNAFLESLNAMIGQTAQVAHTVAAAAEELSVNGTQVSQASRDQASQSTQVASAVEEMSATANEMTRNAQVMAQTAKELSGTAMKGGEVVANSIRGMEAVAGTMQVSSERIQVLGQRSQEIGEIIRVIEDIADQTNLLALNAAIEAARAGEQGRGFAVVADEVRKLAERTGKATKEIAGVIETVQVGTQEAVASMESGTAEVQSGMDLVNEAGLRLNEIVDGVQKVTTMVQQLAGSIDEQTQATEQIAGGIQTVAGLSQQNENSVDQVVTATSDLSEMAAKLQSNLKQFQLA